MSLLSFSPRRYLRFETKLRTGKRKKDDVFRICLIRFLRKLRSCFILTCGDEAAVKIKPEFCVPAKGGLPLNRIIRLRGQYHGTMYLNAIYTVFFCNY